MSRNTPSTRRMFLKGGALLTAPIAAASVSAVALANKGTADDELSTRLARLEDEAAIRALHHAWLQQVNADDAGGALLQGAIRRITPDTGAAERIEVAADGRSAVGRFDCAVELETALAQDCTLAQMAHAQGHGRLRRTERRTLIVDYTKVTGAWTIGKVALKTL